MIIKMMMMMMMVGIIWVHLKITTMATTTTIGPNLCQCQVRGKSSTMMRKSHLVCGQHLNDWWNNTVCDPNKLYLCPSASLLLENDVNRTTMAAAAAAITDCPKKDKIPSKSIICDDGGPHSRHHCLRSMKCSCKRMIFRTNQAFCGGNLQGQDCNPNVIYRCRYMGWPDPIENCPHGCQQRRCRDANHTDGFQISNERNKLNNHNDPIKVKSFEREMEDRDVEFVTFTPIEFELRL